MDLEKAVMALAAIRVAGDVRKKGFRGATSDLFQGVTENVPATLTAIRTGKIDRNLAALRYDLAGQNNKTNDLLMRILMKNGRTPEGVISVGEFTTGDPIADSGDEIINDIIT